MAYIVGLMLMAVGLAVGLLGEYFAQPILLTVGGFLITAGIATLLLGAGSRGGRGDEPGGYIRP